jgi:2-keto-4-pentenoate hydratase
MTTNTTASQAILGAVASALELAEVTGEPIAPISRTHPELTVEDAYAIQAINVRSRERSATAPARVVGHKIGLTSKAMQEMLGVDQPDYGALYDDRVHESGVELELSRLIAPRIEPEWAFVLGEDLSGPEVTGADVRAATDYVMPALEVIDSRIRDWKIGLIDTIADNASCHCAVLGSERHRLADVDLISSHVAMSVKGEVVQHGRGAAVLGDPVEAVAWLANALGAHDVTLRVGQIILSGSITAAAVIAPGDHVIADFGPLGSVEAIAR